VRERERVRLGRNPQPSAAIIDSHTVKEDDSLCETNQAMLSAVMTRIKLRRLARS
jgi:hypothetical protein